MASFIPQGPLNHSFYEKKKKKKQSGLKLTAESNLKRKSLASLVMISTFNKTADLIST